MKIKHIYTTKEGEPMANPYQEYPTFNAWIDSEEVEEQAKAKYHSGLLPFEDREYVLKMVRMTYGNIPLTDDRKIMVRGKYSDGEYEWNEIYLAGRCSICLRTPQEQSHGCNEITCPKGRPLNDTLIPVDLEVEVVERSSYKSSAGFGTIGSREITMTYRKVLHIKP